MLPGAAGAPSAVLASSRSKPTVYVMHAAGRGCDTGRPPPDPHTPRGARAHLVLAGNIHLVAEELGQVHDRHRGRTAQEPHPVLLGTQQGGGKGETSLRAHPRVGAAPTLSADGLGAPPVPPPSRCGCARSSPCLGPTRSPCPSPGPRSRCSLSSPPWGAGKQMQDTVAGEGRRKEKSLPQPPGTTAPIATTPLEAAPGAGDAAASGSAGWVGAHGHSTHGR